MLNDTVECPKLNSFYNFNSILIQYQNLSDVNLVMKFCNVLWKTLLKARQSQTYIYRKGPLDMNFSTYVLQ